MRTACLLCSRYVLVREMKQESRYSDVLSETQIARMNGSSEGRNAGIAEGLRMAAEMFRDSKFMAFKNNVPMGVHGFDFYQQIMAKAKEVEEGK